MVQAGRLPTWEPEAGEPGHGAIHPVYGCCRGGVGPSPSSSRKQSGTCWVSRAGETVSTGPVAQAPCPTRSWTGLALSYLRPVAPRATQSTLTDSRRPSWPSWASLWPDRRPMGTKQPLGRPDPSRGPSSADPPRLWGGPGPQGQGAKTQAEAQLPARPAPVCGEQGGWGCDED